MLEIIVMLMVFVPLLVIGIILLSGRGAFLVAGYNTMSKESKDCYDVKALCRFTGKLVLGISLGVFLLFVGPQLGIGWLSYVGVGIVLLGTLGGIVYANTGRRFLKEGAQKPVSGIASKRVAWAITVVTLIGVCAMFYYGEIDPSVSVHDGRVQIRGMYGTTVDFSDITAISLLDSSMRGIGIGRRTNGYGGFGSTLKGNFASGSAGSTLLFVRADSSPTIHIERDRGSDIYLSLRDAQKTDQLYSSIIVAYEPKANGPTAWQSGYAAVLMEVQLGINDWAGDYSAGGYPVVPFFYLYDIDKCGIPELIVINPTIESSSDVYKYESGLVSKLGRVAFYPFGGLGVPLDKENGLYSDIGYKGNYGEIYYYTIENGVLTELLELEYNNQPEPRDRPGLPYDFANFDRLEHYEVNDENINKVIYGRI